MKGYAAFFSAQFRALLQYRAAALAGFGTQLVWGYLLVMVYEAFYRSSSEPQPMTIRQVVTYVWLGQAFLAMLPWNDDREIQTLIRSGTVSYELLRPLDLYTLWYCRVLAVRTAPTMMRAAPMLVVSSLFLGLQAPASPAALGAFVMAMLGALLLGCAFSTLLNISLLWTVSGQGINVIGFAAVSIFSGMTVPLPLFPKWAQTIIYLLPFRGLVDTPFRLYTGNMPPSELPFLLAHQVAWAAAFVFAGRWALSRGLRSMTVQGG